jgi:hypothetical protein
VSKCVVTKEVVLKKEEPLLVTADPKNRRLKKEEPA